MSHPGWDAQALAEWSSTANSSPQASILSQPSSDLSSTTQDLITLCGRRLLSCGWQPSKCRRVVERSRLEAKLAANEEPRQKAGTPSSFGSPWLRVPIAGRLFASPLPNDLRSQRLTARRALWRRPR